jgi:hypothetical protein
MIVTHVAAAIPNVPAKITPVVSDFTRVGTHLSPICAQLLWRSAFALILPVLANVAATLYCVTAKFTTFGTDLPGVGPHLVAVGAQFATLPAIDIALRAGAHGSNGQQRGQQE